MAVLSLLRSFTSPKNLLLLNYSKITGNAFLRKFATSQSFKMSGGENQFHIIPSKYSHKKSMNLFNFYLLLGIIPLGTLVFLVNIFVGPPELAEIPEGYEPKHWEYYCHPIERFFSRYVYPPQQQFYEKHLHGLASEQRQIKWRKQNRKMKELMAERGDYKAWYYSDIDASYARGLIKISEEKEQFNPGTSDEIL